MRKIENVTLVDGQHYRPGDEIWDLGSFVATSAIGRKRNYEGLSKDVEKLPHYVDTGSSAFCLDTGDFYKYLRSTDIWYKIGNNKASGGGSGVSNYNDLNGKPKINGVTLQGNMTLEDLGIVEIMNASAGTPVGEIISYMGNTVPANYLACDGSEYNISDYQELANHFIKEFGSVNYFGGDGATTFAVPDLRGEFLRGTGTAERNTGTGAAVGTHQDATSHVYIQHNTYDNICIQSKESEVKPENVDTLHTNVEKTGRYWSRNGTFSGNGNASYTSRPTNTSVLYCIKYKPTYFATDGHTYSYEERRVGTWVDGKPLYEKTVDFGSLPNATVKEVPHGIENVDVIWVHDGYILADTGNFIPVVVPLSNMAFTYCNKQKIGISVSGDRKSNIAVITIRYTKTTD